MNLPLYSTSDAISRRRMRYACVNMLTISDLLVSTDWDGASMLCALNGTGTSMVIASSSFEPEDFLARPRCCCHGGFEVGKEMSARGYVRWGPDGTRSRRRGTLKFKIGRVWQLGDRFKSRAARALTCWEATAKDEAVSRARRAMPLPAALRSAAMFSHPRPAEHAKDCDVGGRTKTKKVKSGFTDSFEK